MARRRYKKHRPARKSYAAAFYHGGKPSRSRIIGTRKAAKYGMIGPWFPLGGGRPGGRYRGRRP